MKWVAMACVVAGGWFSPAYAENITFGVLNPHEYDLPTDGFRPFNAAVQYTLYNDGSQLYDDDGQKVEGPRRDLFVGLTKLVHFWTFDKLPDVGFAFEVIQPTVHVSGPGTSVTGFGDTLTGPAIWYKPTANSTIGIQSFVSVPIGSKSVSNRYWASYTSLLFDVEIRKHLSITGDVGGVFRGRQTIRNGPDVKPGNSYHANIRASWRSKSKIEPYLTLDWQTNRSSRTVAGDEIALTKGHDTAIGAGALVALSKSFSVSARYSRSVDGRNVPITNAAYLTLVKLF